jgi:Flp pilus assembly protein TadD
MLSSLRSVACYEKAVEIEPNFGQALNNLAVTLDLGRHQPAEVRYKQVLRLVPNSQLPGRARNRA